MTNTNTMTAREFFVAIAADVNIDKEYRDYALEQIAKLDERNSKRRETPSKAQAENAALIPEVLALFETAETELTAADVAAVVTKTAVDDNGNEVKVAITSNKASVILRSLVESGKLSVRDIRRDKSKVKGYKLAE